MKKKAAVKLLSYGLTGALALGICAVPVSGASVVHAEEAEETIEEVDGEAQQGEEQAEENDAAQDQNESEATGEKTNADIQDTDIEEKEEVEKDGEEVENTDKENTEDKNNEAESDKAEDDAEKAADTEEEKIELLAETENSESASDEELLTEIVFEAMDELGCYNIGIPKSDDYYEAKLTLPNGNFVAYVVVADGTVKTTDFRRFTNEPGTYKVELVKGYQNVVVCKTATFTIEGERETLETPQASTISVTDTHIIISGKVDSKAAFARFYLYLKDGTYFDYSGAPDTDENGNYSVDVAKKGIVYDLSQKGYSQSSYELYATVSAMPSDITKYSQSEQSGKSELFTIQYSAEEDVSSDDAKIEVNDANVANIVTSEANKLYSVYLLKDGTTWYHEEAKSNADKQITNLDMSKYIVESGTYTWTLLDIGNNNKELARISKQITLDAEKLPAPAAPSVELNGKVIHYSGEYANENAGSLWIYAYYTTPYNYTYLFDKKLNLINNGKYDGTIDLNQYYFNYSSLKDMKFKVRVIPKDSNVNTISDFSEYSKAISVSGLSNNTGSDSNSGSSASSGSSDSTGSSDSSDSSSDSSSSSTDSTSSTTTTVAKPVEGVFIDKAAAGEKVNEASVAVSLVDANGVASTVDLKTYMEAASENIVTILAQNTATGTDAQTAVSSILTAPASDSFVATVNALGGNVAINNCGTVKTAATARDAQGNLIASAGRIKNVTSGALILLVSVNEDGSIDYVEGVVDATGNVLGVFNGIPKTISVLVLVPGTV